MQLAIESVAPSKSGKSLVVKANGKQFLAKTDSGVKAGMTIDAETKESEFNGATLVWIEKWRAINGAPQGSSTQPVSAPSSGSQSAPAGAPPIWANFVSNQVAHAIQAGLIQTPEQIKLWAAASKTAYMELM